MANTELPNGSNFEITRSIQEDTQKFFSFSKLLSDSGAIDALKKIHAFERVQFNLYFHTQYALELEEQIDETQIADLKVGDFKFSQMRPYNNEKMEASAEVGVFRKTEHSLDYIFVKCNDINVLRLGWSRSIEKPGHLITPPGIHPARYSKATEYYPVRYKGRDQLTGRDLNDSRKVNDVIGRFYNESLLIDF